MKQIAGFLLTLCCFPLLLLVGSKITDELSIAQAHNETLQNEIQLPDAQQQLPVVMLDRNGKAFSEEYVEWRQPISIEDIPEILKQVFLLSEDQQFYDHIGFNVSAIARAVAANSQGSIEQGGSTITQQLVRMRYLTTDQTYERKVTELFYAYELEKLYSKEEILEMYLNEMYFGNQVYGINAAASYYYQKQLSELSIAQMIFIAAIPNNPSLYDPLQNFDHTKDRQERLLDLLAENGMITQEAAESYKQEEIHLNVKNKKQQFPAYSTYVLHELKQLVASQEGLNEQLLEAQNEEHQADIEAAIDAKIAELLQSGILIHTALDPAKQGRDEQAINAILGSGSLQSSSVVIDNQTREIVSLYAGKQYKKLDFHRAFQAVRQPGSALKPLIVYAPLLETANYTPDSIVSGGAYCIDNFCPQNYAGRVYGNVSISTAFKHSYNTSAVRLLHEVGLDTAFDYLGKFNFSSLVPEDRTYAAGLGGLSYGVTTLEMADAFTSFIDGSYSTAHSIRKVTDQSGNVLYSWLSEREIIWSQKTVQSMRSLMADVVAGGTGKGLISSSSYLGAKTGTTNDYKDYWLAGLNNEYTTAVWIGYDQPQSMQPIQKDQIHFKIFNTIMK